MPTSALLMELQYIKLLKHDLETILPLTLFHVMTYVQVSGDSHPHPQVCCLWCEINYSAPLSVIVAIVNILPLIEAALK